MYQKIPPLPTGVHPVPKPFPYRHRRWPMGLAIGAGILAALLLVLVFAGRPAILSLARFELERKLSDVSDAIGRPVSAGELSMGIFDEVVVENVSIPARDGHGPTVFLESVRLDFSLWDALLGQRSPNRIQIEGCRVEALLEGNHAPDLEDLLKGFRQYRNARKGPGGESGGVSASPELQIERCTLAVTRPGLPIPVAEIKDVAAEARKDEEGSWEISVSGKVFGVAPTEVGFEGVGTVSPNRSMYANLDFDSSISLAGLLGDQAPLALGFDGLTFQRNEAEHTVSVSVRGLRIKDTTAIVTRGPGAKLLVAGGPLSADEVGIAFSEGLLQENGLEKLKNLDLSAVRSVTLRNAAFQVTPARGGFGVLSAKGVDAEVSRDPATGDLRFKGEAGFNLGTLGFTRVSGSASVTDQGQVREATGAIQGPLLAQIVSAVHPRLLAWDGASLDLEVRLKSDLSGNFAALGRVEARGLGYFWTKICLVPVLDLAFAADFEATISVPKETLHLKLDPIEVSMARFVAELDLKGFHSQPKIKARFAIPDQPCGAVASAVPPVMVPRLEGAVFGGTLSLEIKASTDLKNPFNTQIEVEADTEHCQAITLGPRVQIEALNGPYVHQVIEEDKAEPILVGPGTSSYVKFSDIPEVVWQAALATEDMAFYRHHGFKLGLIKRAVILNLDKGWYVYGGSTITQQLVKNLFLSREKTLARKLEEAVIVWEMERKLEKDRILELYLNCIEFGTHIYGIKAAAKTYFNKLPKEMTPLEAAFVMATKPAPRYAYNIYKKRVFNDWWVDRMKGILTRLWKEMNVITEQDVIDAEPYLPLFWYEDEGAYERPACTASRAVPPGMPTDLPREGAVGGEMKPAKPVEKPNWDGDEGEGKVEKSGADAKHPEPAVEPKPEPEPKPEEHSPKMDEPPKHKDEHPAPVLPPPPPPP